ncbi:DrmB family protein [Candidatus Bipolaricaulota bacterium]
MRYELGDVRRSQIITSYGPGAIIDFRAGGYGGAGISVVAAGLDEWDRRAQPPGLGHPQTVYEPRLEKQLDVAGFRLPPVAPQVAPGQYSQRSGKLVGVRFPQWLQCPQCHQIRRSRFWGEDAGDPALYCSECSHEMGGRNRVHVVPVRFIVICERGHLDEFPWDWWVRHDKDCQNRKLKLMGSATAGLAGLVLSCLGCGAHRSMEGCFGPEAVPGQCAGRRPWLGTDADEDCNANPRVVQRGASNLYFSVVESALDIPPWSDDLQKKIGFRWSMLERAADASARRLLVKAMQLSESTRMNEEELLAIIEDRVTRLQSPERNLRWEEYQQFVQHSEPFGENTEFEIRPAPSPPELAGWLQSITRATRLREVRALRGFTRVSPPASATDDRIASISLRPLPWLPAVENRGEGIFIQLRPDRVREWEAQPEVVERVTGIQIAYRRAWDERGGQRSPSRSITPRLLLVHSLAHMLIRQLSLSCGYGNASLRERLYVDTSADWDMAGFLIFTSSPDADGTLGGLVRQGEGANMVRVFEDALTSMAWCSSDPLCIQGVHARSEPSSGAACHSCLLAAETSCEEFNAFLDRALIVGTPALPALGFFTDYLLEIRR